MAKKFDKERSNAKGNSRKGNNNRRANGDRADKSSKASPAKGAPVTASSALLQAAANISFPTTTGYPVNVLADARDATIIGATAFRVPGIIRFGYVPAVGKLKTWTDAFNVWLRDVYTFIRHINSGHANYDAGELGKYFLLYRSCLDYLYWMERLYGAVMGSYVPQNAYAPASIVRDCGGDYNDLLSKLAEFRFYITAYASRLYQMRVPNLKFFQDGASMLSNIYADTELAKASFYIFDPDAFWTYHIGETAEDTYLYLKPKTDSMTLEGIKAFGEELLNTVLNSEDFNIMSGDIMKAYSDYAAVPVIDADFVSTPVYDPSMLWLIHNAGWLRSSQSRAHATIQDWRIHQNITTGPDAGCLMFDALVPLDIGKGGEDSHEYGNLWFRTQHIPVDLPTDQPDAGTVGAVTRFMLGLKPHSSSSLGSPVFEVASCQSEIITSTSMRTDPLSIDTDKLDMNYVGFISKFDQHPMIPNVTVATDQGTGLPRVTFHGGIFIGDVTNFTVMSQDTKANIDMAIMLEKFSDR